MSNNFEFGEPKRVHATMADGVAVALDGTGPDVTHVLVILNVTRAPTAPTAPVELENPETVAYRIDPPHARQMAAALLNLADIIDGAT